MHDTPFTRSPHVAFSMVAACLLPAAALGQDLVINEVMSSNGGTRLDENGDSPDWIEFRNNGGSSLSLEGHGLSDGANPFKWVFPAAVIPPGGHLLVFASGKDRSDVPAHWETVIDEGDEWKYVVPASEPDAAWRTWGYDDESWPTGRTGIGYGDGDDRTQVPAGTISVYARKRFHVDDPAAITHVFLDIDFDDGFVAYLNGEEIARENMANPGRPPAFNEGAATYTEPRLIFGGTPSGYREDRFRSLLRAGENVLAIQVHNSGSGSSDLTLIPFLTLGLNETPAGARGVADILRPTLPSLHTNFKLSADGETVTLTSPGGALVDSVDLGRLPTDVSIGRYPDGLGAFSFHVEPTPGGPNSSAGYQAIGGDVLFSHEGGFYPGSITLTLSTDDPTGTLYFTTDGSVPTEASPRYQSALDIDTTTVVRARVLGAGALPGETATHTFLIDETSTLPVVSIATDPENFFDNEIGIYVLGDDYEASFPHFGANFWEDWERPVHLEFFEADGTVGFSLDAGAKIFGGWSRGHPQRSLSFFARNRYGPTRIRYPIFPEKRIKEYEAFVLRNSGNDWQISHFRDAMMTSLVEDLNVDRQAYRPAVVYINAEYWGIMNLREKVNEHFIAGNHDEVDADELDLLERNAATIHGDAEHYNAMLSLLQNGDVRVPQIYEQVKEMVDIDNFIDYQASQIYFDNTDWPGNNIKFWRPRVEGGRWRWILFDTDFGFGIWNGNNYVNNTLAFALEPNGPGWPNPPWSTFMLRELVTNEEFVADFVNRFATHLNTIFEAGRVTERIDEMAAALEPEMPRQRARWGSSVSAWRSNVGIMRNFALRRVTNVRNHLRSMFGLGVTSTLEVGLSSAGGGLIEIQGVAIHESPHAGVYFRGLPIEITARPHPGYRFTGWSGISPADQATTSVVLTTSSLSIRAGFEIDCRATGKVVINEINYNAADGADPGDWVEVHNQGLSDVNLGGWTFRDEAADHVFTFPPGTILEGGGYLVLCSDVAAFAAFFPEVDNRLGDLGFSLAGGGESLQLLDAAEEPVDSVIYGDSYPWPEEADGEGSTLALKNPVLDNSHASNWAASAAGGTPGFRNDDIYETVDANCVHDDGAFVRGDCNDDGAVDLTDAVCTLSGLFRGTEPGCIAAMNSNGDETVNVSDAIHVLAYLFRGGAAPAAPYPHCGLSNVAADAELGCATPRASCR